jgi:hypothetical protein
MTRLWAIAFAYFCLIGLPAIPASAAHITRIDTPPCAIRLTGPIESGDLAQLQTAFAAADAAGPVNEGLQ